MAVYFCVILPINKLRDLTAAQDEADAEEQGLALKSGLATLQEIRDELKRPITPPSNLLNVRCDRFTWFAEITDCRGHLVWTIRCFARVCSIRGVTWGV